MSPEQRIRLHTWLAWLWLGLTLVTTAWAVYAPDSQFLAAWIIAMSGYANVASHWGAREGAAPSAGQEEAEHDIEAVAERAAEKAVEKALGMARP